MDRTLILVKPDAFARGLTGEILARFERKGLEIVALRSMTVTRELAERHYAEHAERPFFGELVEFITSGPIVAMVLEGDERGEGRAPGDRRDQSAGGGDRLDPRRLRYRRWARTWCTARTRRSPPRARRRCSSRTCVAARPVRPSAPLVLASGSPQRRAILERLGVGLHGARPRGRGARPAATGAGGARERAAKARAAARRARVQRPRGGDGARLRHRGRARRHDLRQARRRASGARDAAALAGARTRCSAALALLDGEREPSAAALARTKVSFRELDEGLLDWYLGPGEWRGRAGGYAIQGAGAALVRALEGDYENVVGLPLAGLLDSAPSCSGRALGYPRDLLQTWKSLQRRSSCRCAEAFARLRPGYAPDERRRGTRAPAATRRSPDPRRAHSLKYGHLQLSDRIRRPRHGGRPRHGQHARVRARTRHRAVRAERRGDRLAHRRSPRGRHRGQAHARAHARARSRRSGP